METHQTGDRIALQVVSDVVIPLQRGDPNTPERKKSNMEIERFFIENHLDNNDIIDAGYFVTDKWEEKKGVIFFVNWKGKTEFIKKSWVIFEKTNPGIFKEWDDYEKKEDKEMEEDHGEKTYQEE